MLVVLDHYQLCIFTNRRGLPGIHISLLHLHMYILIISWFYTQGKVYTYKDWIFFFSGQLLFSFCLERKLYISGRPASSLNSAIAYDTPHTHTRPYTDTHITLLVTSAVLFRHISFSSYSIQQIIINQIFSLMIMLIMFKGSRYIIYKKFVYIEQNVQLYPIMI